MKVSIVTISFNQGRYLKECIDSVLTQDCEDVEYIVVDPGSTDGSREIIDSYGDKIIRIYKRDKGPADGLNKGFSRAAGEIFGFINSDDVLLPGALAHVETVFSGNPDIDVLYGNGYQLDASGRIVRKLYATVLTPRMYAYDAVNIVQQATFFRRAIFENAGGFNADNNLFWDAELFVRMALSGGRSCCTRKFLGGFRIYPESSSGGMGDVAAYRKANRQFKEEILGRRFRRTDAVFVLFYKLLKICSYPRYAYSTLLWYLKEMQK